MRFDGLELTSEEVFNRASDLVRSIGSTGKPTRIEVKMFSTSFALARPNVIASSPAGGNFLDLANPQAGLMGFAAWLTYLTKTRSIMVGDLRFRFIVNAVTGAGTYSGDVGFSKYTGNNASVSANVFPAMKRSVAAAETTWDVATTLFMTPNETSFTTLNITDTVVGFTNVDVTYFFDFDGYVINF